MEEMVPPIVANMIKTKQLFGYRTTDAWKQVAR
jgi:hypothetical protein